MISSWVFFTLVICLSIRGIQLTHPDVEIVRNTNSMSTPQNHNLTGAHCRRRRYLLFEKGAAFSIATASVTSIIPRIPRGLNIISEETVYYELPSTLIIPKVESPQPTSTKPPLTQWQIERKFMQKPFYHMYKHPPYHMYKYKPYHKYKRNLPSTDSLESSFNDSQDIEALFFQQLEKFATTYGYNSRHCIMRTICEAQHFLYPKGQSLFHDIIRIILEFSLPTIMNNKKYFTASKTVNPMDCANLYGPHCRISFLDYFTMQIHGEF